jgi:hypothetical protein
MLVFNQEDHTYFLDGIECISVSEFFKEFEKQFNAKVIAPRAAKKRGVSVEVILAEWEIARLIGISYGNTLHFTIEAYEKYGKMPVRRYLVHIITQYEKLMKPYRDDGWEVIPEDRIGNSLYRVAGSRDIVLRKDGKFKIIDFKTDYDLHNKIKKAHGYLTGPLENFKATRLNVYRVKMSIYAHLDELAGHTFDGLELWHWDDEKFNVIKLDKIDVTELFNHRRRQILDEDNHPF